MFKKLGKNNFKLKIILNFVENPMKSRTNLFLANLYCEFRQNCITNYIYMQAGQVKA